MKAVQRYVAFDGSEHLTVESCQQHEAAHAEQQLCGLTLGQVQGAVSRSDMALADALEAIGAKIARARLASGVRRRAKKKPR